MFAMTALVTYEKVRLFISAHQNQRLEDLKRPRAEIGSKLNQLKGLWATMQKISAEPNSQESIDAFLLSRRVVVFAENSRILLGFGLLPMTVIS